MSDDAARSWGRRPYPAPAAVAPLASTDAQLPAPAGHSLLARGLGRSYGDVCLNDGGTVLDTREMSGVLAFDRQRGVIRAEGGTTLAALLARVIPHGWFLPVTPGTRFVTLAGAIANDVHGKNHHRDGTLGRHVRALELWRSDGSRLACSPTENTDLFAATVGGLGLTGVIRWAEISLAPIESPFVEQQTTRFGSLRDYFALDAGASGDARYTVAWIDAMAGRDARGRGVYFSGDHAAGSLPPDAPARAPRWRVPLEAPNALITRTASRAFNALYWRRAGGARQRVHYEPFFYPLDALGAWNRLYGPRGFYQYQLVVPLADALPVVRAALERIAAHGVTAPLAVLKTFGSAPSPGMLSFPMPGVTLALDVADEGYRTLRLFADLDALVRQAGGRLYPAKDATMSGEDFRAQYPRWREFLDHVDPGFSSTFWRRVMG
jgi:FAD/FMN-containing dehydrogenase